MDSITHLAAGALTPLIFYRAPRTPALILFGIAAGEFPDIDIIAGSSAWATFSVHRVMTHSIPAILLFALLLALLLKLFLSKVPIKQNTVRVENGIAVINRPDDWSLGQMFAAALIALSLHVYLDCMTTFGTQIFWPFHSYRVAVPALFIIDPLLTVPLLFILILCLKDLRKAGKLEKQVKLSRRAVAWIILYPLFCLGLHEGLAYKYNRDYTEVGTAVEKITLAPVLFSPFYWKAVAENSNEYRMSWVASYKLFQGIDFSGPIYPKVETVLWEKLSQSIPIFAAYRNFVSFPTFAISMENEDIKEYTFRDLRYIYSIPNFILQKFDTYEGLFNMQIRVDAGDNLLYAWRYLKSGDDDAAVWTNLHPVVMLK
jgi:inner membrane protein